MIKIEDYSQAFKIQEEELNNKKVLTSEQALTPLFEVSPGDLIPAFPSAVAFAKED